MNIHNNVHIIIIDLQTYWRVFAKETLNSAGYNVRALDNYREAHLLLENTTPHSQNLVILGCTSIDVANTDERMLIAHILEKKQHLLIFSTRLPAHVMRVLFLKGVDDATDKVYEARSLTNIVEQALARIAERSHLPFSATQGV